MLGYAPGEAFDRRVVAEQWEARETERRERAAENVAAARGRIRRKLPRFLPKSHRFEPMNYGWRTVGEEAVADRMRRAERRMPMLTRDLLSVVTTEWTGARDLGAMVDSDARCVRRVLPGVVGVEARRDGRGWMFRKVAT